MKEHHIGIIMNGVTGRMGTNQHLIRSIRAIQQSGGIQIGPGETIMPAPLLVGRNAVKLKQLSKETGDAPWTTDLSEALSDSAYSVYFDAQTTTRRSEAVKAAIAAGKHVYCEKPTATNSTAACELYRLAQQAGVKHGVVQDKLWLPGLLKMRQLIDAGFFGRVLSARGEFGYWVFTGEHEPAQRPSWNYRAADGGGIIVDMLCHWRYVIDNLFGNVTALTCLGATHIPRRWDEKGEAYTCDADDSAYATFTTDKGVVCHFNSSWCVRVRRDDLFVMQVDGTEGSAVAGLRTCWIQPSSATPKAVWNPDVDNPLNHYEHWMEVPSNVTHENAFRTQWELFLCHVVLDAPFRWGLKEGAKGVQLAELGLESWQKRTWVEVPQL